MQRVGNLFPTFCSFENLLSAWRKARSGGRKNEESAAFTFHLELELLALKEELLTGTWQPQPYRYFDIRDPKSRTISVAAFRDRVVHHALVNVLEPIFEKTFIHDSYATRKGKGVHAAVWRAQAFLRKNFWFFKADVEKYFDSIDHGILLALLERKIKDPLLLEVAEKIIRNGGHPPCPPSRGVIGLPIGNLTSQFFANVYLHPFDLFVKETLGVRHYLRYMDDFVIFCSEKERLKSWRPLAEEFLRERLHLRLKPSATCLNSRRNGLSFLGTRVFPALVRIKNENARRLMRKIRISERLLEEGRIGEQHFLRSANSRWACLSAYHTLFLKKTLMKKGVWQEAPTG